MDSNEYCMNPSKYMDKTEPILTDSQTKKQETHQNKLIINTKLINNLNRALKSKSNSIYCPYCKNQDSTKIEKNLNIINLLCFIFTFIHSLI